MWDSVENIGISHVCKSALLYYIAGGTTKPGGRDFRRMTAKFDPAEA